MLEFIMTMVTGVVVIIFGFLTKRHKWIRTNLIPLQNLAIGLISAVIYFLITKDFSLAVTSVGLLASGVYDISHNIMKIINNKEQS